MTSARDKLHLLVAAVPGRAATAQSEILEIGHRPTVLKCGIHGIKLASRGSRASNKLVSFV